MNKRVKLILTPVAVKANVSHLVIKHQYKLSIFSTGKIYKLGLLLLVQNVSVGVGTPFRIVLSKDVVM